MSFSFNPFTSNLDMTSGGGSSLPSTVGWVNSFTGDDGNPGTEASPKATIQSAYDDGFTSFAVIGNVGNLAAEDEIILLFGFGRALSIVGTVNFTGAAGALIGNGSRSIAVGNVTFDAQAAFSPTVEGVMSGDVKLVGANGGPGANGDDGAALGDSGTPGAGGAPGISLAGQALILNDVISSGFFQARGGNGGAGGSGGSGAAGDPGGTGDGGNGADGGNGGDGGDGGTIRARFCSAPNGYDVGGGNHGVKGGGGNAGVADGGSDGTSGNDGVDGADGASGTPDFKLSLLGDSATLDSGWPTGTLAGVASITTSSGGISAIS